MQSLKGGVSTVLGPIAKHFEWELANLLHAGREVTYNLPLDVQLMIWANAGRLQLKINSANMIPLDRLALDRFERFACRLYMTTSMNRSFMSSFYLEHCRIPTEAIG
jgi:hypothetical protein